MNNLWGDRVLTPATIKDWSDRNNMARLRRDGIITLPWRFTSRQITAMTVHLKRAPIFNAHVKAKATQPPSTLEAMRVQKIWPMMCHDMADVVNAPYLFEFAVQWFDFVREYFDGEFPRLYSMNAFWTAPAPGAPPYLDTHGWHHDDDDRKQLVMFVMLTDVNLPEQGAHLYQRGTHLIPDSALGRDFRDPDPDLLTTITGQAGQVFLADTRGLHIGMRPNQLRGLAWARWGVSNPPVSYGWDQLKPVLLRADYRAFLNSFELRQAVDLVAV